MEPRALLDALTVAERLKDTTRHCYTSQGRHESVAEHSWMMTLMVFFMQDEFPEADMDKVMRMCVLHDLGECFTGDIPTFLKTNEQEKTEAVLLENWVDALPETARMLDEGDSVFPDNIGKWKQDRRWKQRSIKPSTAWKP